MTAIAGKKLIDFALDGFQAAGIREVTCIVNEAATAVRDYVEASKRPFKMDWIVKTTPSSMHSFLIVLERLSQSSQGPFFLTTVDSVCDPQTYVKFAQRCQYFSDADVVLGLTDHIDDEKPLRVAMRGFGETGVMPENIEDGPEAYEIIALTNNGFASEYVTGGFYLVRPTLLREKDRVLSKNFSALREYLGYLLRTGYRFYGVPLPAIMDVDRPQDIEAAERSLREKPLMNPK